MDREHFLATLANIHAIRISARFVDEQYSTRLLNVKMEVGVERHLTPSYVSLVSRKALGVERCECPKGYMGTSCESCATGYRRPSKTKNNLFFQQHFQQCEPIPDSKELSIRIESDEGTEVALENSTLVLNFTYTVSYSNVKLLYKCYSCNDT